MVYRLKLVSVVCTLILLVALVLTTCAPAKPVTAEKKVKIGLLTFDTGAVSDCGFPSALGAHDIVRYYNDTDGIPGTEGMKIDLVRIDHGYDIPRAVAAYDKMVHQDKVLGIASWGSSPNDALRDKAIKDGIAVVTCGCAHDLLWPVTVWFSAGPSYPDLVRGLLKWCKEVDWPKKGESRKPKLASITADNAFGWSHIVGVLTGAEMFGFEMIPLQFEPFGTMDATGTALKLKEYKPDYIHIAFTQHGMSVVSRDLKRAGVTPSAQLIGFTAGADPTCIPRSEGGISGIYLWSPWAMFSEDLPGINKLKEVLLKYHPSADPNVPVLAQGCFFAGFASMGVLLEGVGAAISDKGYENLSREAVVRGIESLKDVNMWDVMSVTCSGDDHRAGRQMKVVQLKADGSMVPVSGWFEVPGFPDWERRGEKLPKSYIP